jgi:hypothetical protein
MSTPNPTATATASATTPTATTAATSQDATATGTPATPAAGDTLLTATPPPKAGEGEGGNANGQNPDDKATKAGKDGDKPAAPPEKYEFAMPDGIELDATLVAKFDPIARELGLSQDGAQKLATMYAEQQQEQANAWANQVQEWGKQAQADPVLVAGGFDANLGLAKAAFSRYADAEAAEVLDTSGLGNHPAILRMFLKLAQATKEDAPPSGHDSTRPVRTPAERMYPNMAQS